MFFTLNFNLNNPIINFVLKIIIAFKKSNPNLICFHKIRENYID